MITASIVTHHTDPTELDRCASLVLRSPEVAHLYIIDNSRDLSLRDMVEKIANRIRESARADEAADRISYTHVENRGYGAGHNVAIRQSMESGAEAHLVLNADTWWEEDVITRMVRYMRTNPDVGMMMPKVYYPDGDLQLTARCLPTPVDLFAKRFLPKSLIRRRMDRYLLVRADHDRIINSPYLLGSFLLIRREALETVGIFDERFFMYPEDIDMTRRVHRHYRTILYPEVSIIHHHAAASRQNIKMLRIHIANMCRYFCKWGWIFDSERRAMNRQLLANLPMLPADTPTPPSRG